MARRVTGGGDGDSQDGRDPAEEGLRNRKQEYFGRQTSTASNQSGMQGGPGGHTPPDFGTSAEGMKTKSSNRSSGQQAPPPVGGTQSTQRSGSKESSFSTDLKVNDGAPIVHSSRRVPRMPRLNLDSRALAQAPPPPGNDVSASSTAPAPKAASMTNGIGSISPRQQLDPAATKGSTSPRLPPAPTCSPRSQKAPRRRTFGSADGNGPGAGPGGAVPADTDKGGTPRSHTDLDSIQEYQEATQSRL